jgi:hypothetical protein
MRKAVEAWKQKRSAYYDMYIMILFTHYGIYFWLELAYAFHTLKTYTKHMQQSACFSLTLDLQLLSVPEIIDLVFAKTSSKRSFSMTEYERFGLVFPKTRVYKFGHSARNSVPQPFRIWEKHSELSNFVPNHSAEDTNARSSFRTIFYAVKHKFGNFEGFFLGACAQDNYEIR